MTRLDEARFEELSERWLDGDESQIEQLRAAAAGDPALELELRLLEELRAANTTNLDGAERDLLDRVVARVTRQAPPQRPWQKSAMVAAGALLVLSATAAAAYWVGVRSGASSSAVTPPAGGGRPSAPTSAPVPGPDETAAPTFAPVPRPDEAAPQDLSDPGEVSAPPRGPTAAPATQGERGQVGRRPAPTAAELFARAGSQRRRGHPEQAARLYTQLQRQHPNSPEALASHLSLARLMLTRLNDPRTALRQLEAYLRAAPDGPLAPECRYQRAVALRRLGRPESERRALELSLSADPDSVYAPAVRRRLAELERARDARTSEGRGDR